MSGEIKRPTPEEQASEITVLEEVTAPDTARPSGEGSVGLVKGSDGKTAEERANEVNTDPTEADEADEADEVDEADEADDDGSDEADEADDDGSDEGLSLDELLNDEEPKPKNRNKVPARKRIAELTAHRRAAEEEAVAQKERADKLELELKNSRNAAQLTDDQGDGKPEDKGNSDARSDTDENAPKPEDFKYGELDPEYTKAIAKHEVEKAVAADRAAREAERQTVAEQERAAEIDRKYTEKREAGAAIYDDFEEKVVRGAETGAYPLTPDTAVMALESPVGEKVLYDIASNVKLAKQLANMSPMQQAQTFGRLEARHTAAADSKPKNKKVTKAPTPPTKRSRGVNSRGSLDPKSASIADLERKWNADGRI